MMVSRSNFKFWAVISLSSCSVQPVYSLRLELTAAAAPSAAHEFHRLTSEFFRDVLLDSSLAILGLKIEDKDRHLLERHGEMIVGNPFEDEVSGDRKQEYLRKYDNYMNQVFGDSGLIRDEFIHKKGGYVDSASLIKSMEDEGKDTRAGSPEWAKHCLLSPNGTHRWGSRKEIDLAVATFLALFTQANHFDGKAAAREYFGPDHEFGPDDILKIDKILSDLALRHSDDKDTRGPYLSIDAYNLRTPHFLMGLFKYCHHLGGYYEFGGAASELNVVAVGSDPGRNAPQPLNLSESVPESGSALTSAALQPLSEVESLSGPGSVLTTAAAGATLVSAARAVIEVLAGPIALGHPVCERTLASNSNRRLSSSAIPDAETVPELPLGPTNVTVPVRGTKLRIWDNFRPGFSAWRKRYEVEDASDYDCLPSHVEELVLTEVQECSDEREIHCQTRSLRSSSSTRTFERNVRSVKSKRVVNKGEYCDEGVFEKVETEHTEFQHEQHVNVYTLHPNARDSGPIWKDLGVSAGQDAVAGLFTAKDAAGKPIARTLNAWELRLKPKKGKLQELVKNEAKFPLIFAEHKPEEGTSGIISNGESQEDYQQISMSWSERRSYLKEREWEARNVGSDVTIDFSQEGARRGNTYETQEKLFVSAVRSRNDGIKWDLEGEDVDREKYIQEYKREISKRSEEVAKEAWKSGRMPGIESVFSLNLCTSTEKESCSTSTNNSDSSSLLRVIQRTLRF